MKYNLLYAFPSNSNLESARLPRTIINVAYTSPKILCRS